MMATPAFAQTYKFVIVPKAMNNPFFDFTRDGCGKRAKELGNIECIYKGPVEHEPATQAQIIQDFITQKVDGLAISVADVAAMTKSIEAATAAGIPVITFDADAPGSKRVAYIGTNNKEFGLALGKELLKLRPDGGKYAMISGGPGAENLAERVNGVREALKGSKWIEVSGSPTFCNDDPALGVQQLTDLRTATPNLAAIIPIGGWPMFAPEGFKAFAGKSKKDMDAGKFTLVAADNPQDAARASERGLRQRSGRPASVRDGRESDGYPPCDQEGPEGAGDRLHWARHRHEAECGPVAEVEASAAPTFLRQVKCGRCSSSHLCGLGARPQD
jgi:ribose transport system substrate-binding protein